MKVFVIQEIGFEFNDMYHFECSTHWGASAGYPKTAWRSRHMADIECRRMNLQCFREDNVFMYGYNFYDEYVEGCTEEDFLRLGLSLSADENNKERPLEHLSDKDLEWFFDRCRLRFYEVVPVDVQDEG